MFLESLKRNLRSLLDFLLEKLELLYKEKGFS